MTMHMMGTSTAMPNMTMTGSTATRVGKVNVDGTQGSNVPGTLAVVNPPSNDPRFAGNSTGPNVAKEGDAKTIKLKDGKTLDGSKGRAQNAGDKEQNNYSVTDANFNNQWGVLKDDTYNGTTGAYGAAGFIQRDPRTAAMYDVLVKAQNDATQRGAQAGDPTILEGAKALLGLAPEPAWFRQYGLTGGAAANLTIPGSTLTIAKYVASGRDITGQEWARPHHAQSSANALYSMLDLGVPVKDAMVLAGDDGVSGAGRLNGVNNQDGNDSFNGGEIEIWSKAAQLDQQGGYNGKLLQALSHSHAMTSMPADALTNPNINKILNKKAGAGIAENERDMTEARALALKQVLLDGTVGNAKKANADGTKADNKKLAGDVPGAEAEAAGGGGDAKQARTTGGGGSAQATAGACALGPAHATGGGEVANGSLASILQQLVAALQQMVSVLQAMSGASQLAPLTAATGGGATTTSPAISTGALPVTTVSTPARAPMTMPAMAAAPAPAMVAPTRAAPVAATRPS